MTLKTLKKYKYSFFLLIIYYNYNFFKFGEPGLKA